MRVSLVEQVGLQGGWTEYEANGDILVVRAHLPTGPVEERYDLSGVGAEPVAWHDILPEAPFGFLLRAVRAEDGEVEAFLISWPKPEVPDAGAGT